LRPRALDAIVEGVALWYAWQAAIVVRAIIPTSHHTRADLFVAGYKLHPRANPIFESTVFVCWKFCLARALNWLDLCANAFNVSIDNVRGKRTKNKPNNGKAKWNSYESIDFLGDLIQTVANKQKVALFLIILAE
jgi:hypothetical protein